MVAAIHYFIAELKGNPAKIRNYPRSCKSFGAINVITFLKNPATAAHSSPREGSESGKVRKPAVSQSYVLTLSGEKR